MQSRALFQRLSPVYYSFFSFFSGGIPIYSDFFPSPLKFDHFLPRPRIFQNSDLRGVQGVSPPAENFSIFDPSRCIFRALFSKFSLKWGKFMTILLFWGKNMHSRALFQHFSLFFPLFPLFFSLFPLFFQFFSFFLSSFFIFFPKHEFFISPPLGGYIFEYIYPCSNM